MEIIAVRGATTVDADTEAEIRLRSVELYSELTKRNGLVKEGVISVVISTTADITAFYPAAAVREAGLVTAPLFSALEPPIKNSLPLCIRFLVTAKGQKDAKHVYLRGAEILRKDLKEGE